MPEAEEDDECCVECGRRGDCERIRGWDDTSVADERSDSTGDHEGPVTSVAKDGSQIASGFRDCGVRVWRARDRGTSAGARGAWAGSDECSVEQGREPDREWVGGLQRAGMAGERRGVRNGEGVGVLRAACWYAPE